jgi:Cytochrome c7 and related cytochrome c
VDPRRIAVLLVLLLMVSVVVRARPAVAPQAPPPQGPVQPIPYSHKQHLALSLQCRTCHVNPDAGKLMTYPPAQFCMGCHQTIAADRPSIQKLAEFAASGKPIPWVRVYQVPDYVYWQHGSHLEAKVDCAECHGPVAERDVIALETNVVKMLGCVTCHDKRQAYTDCGACHAPRQSSLVAQPFWAARAPEGRPEGRRYQGRDER